MASAPRSPRPARTFRTRRGAQSDCLLAGMQTASAKKGMQAAFNASPEILGRAAVKAARKRG